MHDIFSVLALFLFLYKYSGNLLSFKIQIAGTDHGGVPALSTMQNSVVQAKPATSSSSREQSDDDDELEGEAETNENAGPTDIKRVRRYVVCI